MCEYDTYRGTSFKCSHKSQQITLPNGDKWHLCHHHLIMACTQVALQMFPHKGC